MTYLATFIPSLLFLLSGNSTVPSEISETCRDKLLGSINNFIKDSTLTSILARSGKGIGDLGDYKECSEDPNMNYFVLDIGGLPAVVAMGLCVPEQCRAQDLSYLKPSIVTFANSMMKSNGINKTLHDTDIKFIDPRTVENVYGIPFIVLGIVILLVLALNIFSVYVRYYQPESVNKKDEIEASDFTSTVAHFFDPIKNFRALTTDYPERLNPDLKFFSGFRVICMLWVIIGHILHYSQLSAVMNPFAIRDFIKEFRRGYIANSYYSVDVFFFLSAFFAFYLIYSELQANGGVISFWRVYVHRLIRMSVLNSCAVISFTWLIFILVEGPMKYKFSERLDNGCRQTWYANLLYYNNWLPTKDECAGWLWYIPNDVQLYLLVPIFAYAYYRSKIITVLSASVLGIGCLILTYILAYIHDLSGSNLKFNDDYYNYFYDRPYARITPYLLGMYVCMIYLSYKTEKEGYITKYASIIKESKVVRYSLYVISLTAMFWLVHMVYWINNYPESWNKCVEVAYITLNKPSFIFFLSFLCFGAFVSKASFLRNFLGHPIMYIMAKVSYPVYMFHPLIINYFLYIETKGEFFNPSKANLRFVGVATTAILSCILLCGFIEFPFRFISRKYIHPYNYPALDSEGRLVTKSANNGGTNDNEEETTAYKNE